jgi:hypothetical protein
VLTSDTQPLLESRLADAEAAVAEGLQVASGNLGLAAPLYVLGMRAAADRAELARAHRNADQLLEARRLGTLGVELRAQMSPERADGAVPTPPTKAYAAVGEAELARLTGRSEPSLWTAAAQAWEQLTVPYPAAYARWREAEALLAGWCPKRACGAVAAYGVRDGNCFGRATAQHRDRGPSPAGPPQARSRRCNPNHR